MFILLTTLKRQHILLYLLFYAFVIMLLQFVVNLHCVFQLRVYPDSLFFKEQEQESAEVKLWQQHLEIIVSVVIIMVFIIGC